MNSLLKGSFIVRIPESFISLNTYLHNLYNLICVIVVVAVATVATVATVSPCGLCNCRVYVCVVTFTTKIRYLRKTKLNMLQNKSIFRAFFLSLSFFCVQQIIHALIAFEHSIWLDMSIHGIQYV